VNAKQNPHFWTGEFMNNEVVKFSSDTLTGTARKRSGVIFRAGNYPDKQCRITEADIKAIAINTVAPVPVDVEHGASAFSGKLGHFTRIWAQGAALFGEWHEPQALTDLIGDVPRKVSVALNLTLKRIDAVSLVLTPRVADAIVFSAESGSEDIDWAEVNRARKEAGLPPRTDK